MSPVPFFQSRRGVGTLNRRRGVSELYASLLMLGVTVSLGSVATGLITNQFSLTATAVGAGASLGESAAGVQLSFVYATVAPSARCPANGIAPEGNVLAFTVFNYGSTRFTPVVIAVNGSLYSPPFPTVEPGGMATFRLALTTPGTCAHSWGQTVLMADSTGDDFQLET
jgi:flagellin-like protein